MDAMAARFLRGVLALLPIPSWACSCGVGPVQYCGQAPDLSNQKQAVFVGIVRDFYPKSHEQMDQLLNQFYQSHPDLRPGPSSRAGRAKAGAPSDDQEFRREFIRSLWGDSLNGVEQEQLRNADQQELNRLMFDYRRRAHLQVLENFGNAEGLEFEVYTNLDGPSCGFDFIEGETYLVEAYRNDSNQRWKVSSCVPPRLVSAAPFEVNALRAWKAGVQPRARIFGDVFSPDGHQSPAGIKLQLLGGDQPLETISDSRGGFEFQNLATKNYQLVWGTGAPRARAIDMTHAWCARVFLPR
jgi:hypothetical protein